MKEGELQAEWWHGKWRCVHCRAIVYFESEEEAKSLSRYGYVASVFARCASCGKDNVFVKMAD